MDVLFLYKPYEVFVKIQGKKLNFWIPNLIRHQSFYKSNDQYEIHSSHTIHSLSSSKIISHYFHHQNLSWPTFPQSPLSLTMSPSNSSRITSSLGKCLPTNIDKVWSWRPCQWHKEMSSPLPWGCRYNTHNNCESSIHKMGIT